MKRLFGIIDSMTPDERRNPSKTIDQSRRRRIAAGAGVEPHEVNELVKQFDAMAQMMTSMAGKGMRERMKMVRELQSGMMQNPNGLAKKKGRHRQAPVRRRKRPSSRRSAKRKCAAANGNNGGAAARTKTAKRERRNATRREGGLMGFLCSGRRTVSTALAVLSLVASWSWNSRGVGCAA